MIIENGPFTVYMHINKINGKMYVGITKRKPEERWKNGADYKNCIAFNNAIKKYGWDNFEHVIFASNLTEDEACNIERLLIEKLELQNSKYGYNINKGGKKASLGEETKKKIGDALRGRTISPEIRKIYSEAHKGIKRTPEAIKKTAEANRGKKRTPEQLEKMREVRLGMKYQHHKTPEELHEIYSKAFKEYYKTHKREPHDEKKVLCIETNTVYRSIEAAAKELSIVRSSISECASGKRKSAGGYHWQFVLETLETTERTSEPCEQVG